jgi:hypothetical protein
MATSVDRLVRKEVALGSIREKLPPTEHIGMRIAPMFDVETDDVIFDYIKGGLSEGLAPARAEDAEAELALKDELTYGQGRAAVIDWSIKDRYTASDVSRYRDSLLIAQATQGIDKDLNFNFVGKQTDDFERRMARHDALRRRKLDNRLEQLVMTSIETSGITYNDGKIKFTVAYGRPADQTNAAPAGGLWGLGVSDPIGDLIARQDLVYSRVGIRPTRGIISTRVLNNIWKSSRFLAALGVPVVGGTPNVTVDPNYLGLAGYNPRGALAVVEQATGIRFEIYDGYYRTRAFGSQSWVTTKFLSDNKVYLLPEESMSDAGEAGNPDRSLTGVVTGVFDETEIGFAKMLTSPHPEGDWTPGYYEWEDETRDPWQHVRGSGIKAFPIFPYMEYTDTMTVL